MVEDVEAGLREGDAQGEDTLDTNERRDITHWGVIAPGQSYRPLDPALTRYLHSLLRPAIFQRSRAIPTGAGQTKAAQSEASKEGERKVSSGWSAWPFSRSDTPVQGSETPPIRAPDAKGDESSPKWLGLGALGEAVGSVGTVFGIKGRSVSATPAPVHDAQSELVGSTNEPTEPEGPAPDTESAAHMIPQVLLSKSTTTSINHSSRPPSIRSTRPPSVMTTVDVAIPELTAAQVDDPAGTLLWERKKLWVREGKRGQGEWRWVKWIIVSRGWCGEDERRLTASEMM